MAVNSLDIIVGNAKPNAKILVEDTQFNVGTSGEMILLGAADPTAIHDNIANEISAITEKTTPINQDLLVIEDSQASNIKKKIQIINLPYPQTGYGSYSNLKINNNAVSPNSKIDISWDMLQIQDIKTLVSSFTLDATVFGIGGLDVAEGASTWYYIWAIANVLGSSGIIGSSSSTTINPAALPAGYNRKRLIGMVYNNAGSNFVAFYQQNKDWFYSVKKDMITLTDIADSGTARNVTEFIPELVSLIYCSLFSLGLSSGGQAYFKTGIGGYINGAYIPNQLCDTVYEGSSANYAISENSGIVITYNRYIYTYYGIISGCDASKQIICKISGFEVPL